MAKQDTTNLTIGVMPDDTDTVSEIAVVLLHDVLAVRRRKEERGSNRKSPTVYAFP